MVWLLGRMKCSASGAELPETSGTPTNHNLRDSAASAAEIRSGVRRVYALISYSCMIRPPDLCRRGVTLTVDGTLGGRSGSVQRSPRGSREGAGF